MKRIPLLAVVLLLLAVASAACSQAGPAGPAAPGVAPAPRPAAPPAPESRPGVAVPSVQERLTVREARISLLVTDVPGVATAVQDLAARLGGYVVSASRSYRGDEPVAQVSLRVPAARFDEAMAELRRMAVRVPSENIDAKDVTEEYTDLQAQLRNAEATEKRVLALLERAQTVDDVLKVQRELSNVRGQIERLKGRIQFLERTTSTSLIAVEIRAAASAAPIVAPGWLPLETGKEALRALVQTGQVFANVGIWALIFAPIWAPLTFLGIYLRRRWRRRRKPAATPLPPQAATR